VMELPRKALQQQPLQLATELLQLPPYAFSSAWPTGSLGSWILCSLCASLDDRRDLAASQGAATAATAAGNGASAAA